MKIFKYENILQCENSHIFQQKVTVYDVIYLRLKINETLRQCKFRIRQTCLYNKQRFFKAVKLIILG